MVPQVNVNRLEPIVDFLIQVNAAIALHGFTIGATNDGSLFVRMVNSDDRLVYIEHEDGERFGVTIL